MVCIYCLIDKPESKFQRREHVFPQCYGKFKTNNLILNKIVCDECNQYFGDKLELYLGRDTIEGVMRYQHRIKPKKQVKHQRLKFKIVEGELRGLIVTPIYSDLGEHIDNLPVLQVGFFNNLKDCFDYYEPDEIPHVETLKKEGKETKNIKISFIYKNDQEKQVLLNKLRQRGHKPTDVETPMEWPEEVRRQNQTLVRADIRLDKVIIRGFCKIAFNYLAFIQGRSFVLSGDFDPIRKFIRTGEGNEYDFLFVNQSPILEEDRVYNIKTTLGHLIIIEWRGMSLSSKLSLFNMWTHLIRFCTNYKGVWVPISSGHHFDVESRSISPLHSISRTLVSAQTIPSHLPRK